MRPVEAAPSDAPAEIPVAIVGRPNAGKSSLFNAIVGEPRTIVSEIAGTTRDAIDTAVTTDEGTFRFIDTAGMRKAAKVSGVEYYSYLRSVQSLDRAHVAVIVADATMRFGELDLSICTEAARNHCATVIAVNKTDIAEADLEEIAGIARRKLRQRPIVIPVSAVTHRGVRQLLAEVASLEARFAAHISTGELNRALATLAADRPLPMKRGKRLKMYYIAQFGTSPPRFAIEVNDRTLVTRDFGFFVENRLRAQLRARWGAAGDRLQRQEVSTLQFAAFVAALLLAYLMGAIPFGVVVGKLFYHVDVREHGSGNVGTTNVFRVLGKKAGAVVLVCDMLKGYIPAFIAAYYLRETDPWLVIVIAAAPVVGHMYSVFLKGRGGKGVATGAGVVIALIPLAGGIIAVVWVTLILTTRYVSLASLVATLLVPVFVFALGDPLPYLIAAVLVTVGIFWAHRGNISRLLKGTENRVTLPWSRDTSALAGKGES